MIKVKKYVGLLCAMLSIGALVASCSSEEEMAQGVADQRPVEVGFERGHGFPDTGH